MNTSALYILNTGVIRNQLTEKIVKILLKTRHCSQTIGSTITSGEFIATVRKNNIVSCIVTVIQSKTTGSHTDNLLFANRSLSCHLDNLLSPGVHTSHV